MTWTSACASVSQFTNARRKGTAALGRLTVLRTVSTTRRCRRSCEIQIHVFITVQAVRRSDNSLVLPCFTRRARHAVIARVALVALAVCALVTARIRLHVRGTLHAHIACRCDRGLVRVRQAVCA